MSTEQATKHLCKLNFHKDVEIRFEKINTEQSSWVLDQTWNQSGMSTKEANSESGGEPIRSSNLLIQYCPFCGEDLTLKQKNTW